MPAKGLADPELLVANVQDAALLDPSQRVVRGRWHGARKPNECELAATAVVSFALDEASAKVRTGPPIDDEEDYARPFWAGVISLTLRAEEPISGPRLSSGIETPEYAVSWARPTGAAG